MSDARITERKYRHFWQGNQGDPYLQIAHAIIEEIKRGHKLRTKQKRAFKREVADVVRRFFQAIGR